MPSLRAKVVLTAWLAATPGLGGCASDSDARDKGATTGAPDQSAESTPKRVAKKADLPDLPHGAGPIDTDAPEEFTRTSTGLYYRILRKSNGRKPRHIDTVIAHYKGWLKNGKQFDSSYDRGDPATFSLKGVVPGWREGVQLVGVGGMIELEMPPSLGYGTAPQPGIPPNSTLHFIIELQEIE
jgi:FKBP-type peptidyl-prolyl cis-trans isomerase FkpA